MGMDVSTFRKLVALDVNDPLNRFGLGKKLFEEDQSQEALTEAAEHLRFANAKAPEHLATYHILGQVLIKLGQTQEAKQVSAKLVSTPLGYNVDDTAGRTPKLRRIGIRGDLILLHCFLTDRGSRCVD